LVDISFIHPAVGLLELLEPMTVFEEVTGLSIAVGVYVKVDVAWSGE
jgi:hypothetical protein